MEVETKVRRNVFFALCPGNEFTRGYYAVQRSGEFLGGLQVGGDGGKGIVDSATRVVE